MTHDPSNPYFPPPPAAPQLTPPPLVRDANGVAVLRGSAENRQRLRIMGPIALVVAIVVGFLRYGPGGGITIVVAVGVVLAITAVIAWRARTTVTPTAVIRSLFGGRGRTFQLADVGEVILFPRLQFGAAQAPPFLVARDRAGRRLFAMSSPLWAPMDLLALAFALTPRPAVYEQPMKARDVDRQHPGSMRFHEKHPVWFALGLVMALLVAIIVLVLALGAF